MCVRLISPTERRKYDRFTNYRPNYELQCGLPDTLDDGLWITDNGLQVTVRCLIYTAGVMRFLGGITAS